MMFASYVKFKPKRYENAYTREAVLQICERCVLVVRNEPGSEDTVAKLCNKT
jgi:hypothetical protein